MPKEISDNELRIEAVRAIDLLPLDQAVAIFGKTQQGYSDARVGDELGLSEEEARQLYYSGLRHLKEIIFDKK